MLPRATRPWRSVVHHGHPPVSGGGNVACRGSHSQCLLQLVIEEPSLVIVNCLGEKYQYDNQYRKLKDARKERTSASFDSIAVSGVSFHISMLARSYCISMTILRHGRRWNTSSYFKRDTIQTEERRQSC
jgi:hypothetical protein